MQTIGTPILEDQLVASTELLPSPLQPLLPGLAMPLGGIHRHVPTCETHRGPQLKTATCQPRAGQAEQSRYAHTTEYYPALRMNNLQLEPTL